MLRKDREMSEEFGLGIIDDSDYGTLCLTDENGRPYGVPLCFARDGSDLYFHGAHKGRKMDCIKHSSNAHIVFVRKCNVPDVMTRDEAEQAASSPDTVRLLGSKVFTFEFESAEVEGTAELVTSDEEKMHALRLICGKYTPQWMDLFEKAAVPSLKMTAICRIRIGKVTAKRKKFDPHGEEMKWGRMV